MEDEGPHEVSNTAQKVDVTHAFLPYASSEIAIDLSQIAGDRWKEMCDFTREDGKERGISIYEKAGRLSETDIYIGTGSAYQDEESVGIREPFRLRIFNRPKKIVQVHTHPFRADEEQLPASLFSGSDIQHFSDSDLHMFMMVDTNGNTHTLLRDQKAVLTQRLTDGEGNEIRKKAMQAAEGDSQTVAQARKNMAVELAKHGIYYYFAPTDAPQGVNFSSILKLKRADL